ncbi:hypothetical protein GGR54DRAFT_636098 [Hypoxylon sp. NC1633]|nr:hypothetical protein GGR54DRAFT_636098 [Hypoxylon sp. NC1633]
MRFPASRPRTSSIYRPSTPQSPSPPLPGRLKPAPFQYPANTRRTLPDLDDDELDDIAAVLRALARGSYPRLSAVPLALNAYNCDRSGDGSGSDGRGDGPWAYFHPVTVVAPEDRAAAARPEIELDGVVGEDLGRAWVRVRGSGGYAGEEEGEPGMVDIARYRFMCFIHKHRIDRRTTCQKGVHTISIWDREWDELTWHDTYHVNRETRRREIRRFWERANAPGLIEKQGLTREQFMGRIRYRTVYHICEHIEDTIRDAVPPRHTLWAVMSAALFHMNHARDPQVSIVPDQLELFGGQARALLPRLFAHLLLLCLDCRPWWGRARREAFVARFRVLDRLRWMRVRAREHFELRGLGGRGGGGKRSISGSDGSNSGGTDDGGNEDMESRGWIYGILKI